MILRLQSQGSQAEQHLVKSTVGKWKRGITKETHSAPWHCQHFELKDGEVNTNKSEKQQTVINNSL